MTFQLMKIACVLGCFFSMSQAFGADESTLATTYPSPRGVYEELRAANNTYLASQGGNVGIGTTTPGATLDVAGAMRVGSRGTLIQQIQSGVVEGKIGSLGIAGISGSDDGAASVPSAAPGTAWVPFAAPGFSSLPQIILTLDNSDVALENGGFFPTECRVVSRTTQAFKFTCTCTGDTSLLATRVYWMAIN